jgi:CDP-diacylglycerol---serine O-phosphatidyltransferase
MSVDSSGTEPVQRTPRWSLIRSLTLADWVTLVNATCGVLSVFSALEYTSGEGPQAAWLALGLIPVAGIADFFDGRIARRIRRQSILGADLDSLADLLSFGLAPAAIAFALGLNGGWDKVLLVYFVCCGLSRLARFNVTAAELADTTGKVKYFEGTPIPSSVGLVAIIAALYGNDRMGANVPFGVLSLGWELHPLSLLFAVSGTAMISKRLRVPKF